MNLDRVSPNTLAFVEEILSSSLFAKHLQIPMFFMSSKPQVYLKCALIPQAFTHHYLRPESNQSSGHGPAASLAQNNRRDNPPHS